MQVVCRRRPHTKSRHGCLQCKKKRTKCDEGKPSCNRCARTGAACSFLAQNCSLVVITASHSKLAQKSNKVNAKAFSKTHKNQGLDNDARTSSNKVLVEMNFTAAERHRFRLMNHYLNFTYQSLTKLTLNNADGVWIWRAFVPQLAFEHEFLLEALLGLSSLHLALSQPYRQSESIEHAVQHYDKALALGRPHLSNITEYQINALFVFSFVVTGYSLGIHRIFPSQVGPLVKINEIMTLLRGASMIANLGSQWLDQTPLISLKRPHETEYTQSLSPELEDILAQLSKRINTTIGTAAGRQAYINAIALVRHSFLLAISGQSVQKTMALFPILIDMEFLAMVHLGEPLALTILAHYGVILYWLRGHVWLEGWGKLTLDAVRQALPTNWHVCIAWALQEVGDGQAERSLKV
ncbi:hypothetical protein V1525DRAFT_398651 [Lipomyces kononenkoae]|uniref:Uncharacterized protein n=1 Tax=Lipomyces kononenkoae TaxID=34357 RepID=A0ACC3T6W1_LIPKO